MRVLFGTIFGALIGLAFVLVAWGAFIAILWLTDTVGPGWAIVIGFAVIFGALGAFAAYKDGAA